MPARARARSLTRHHATLETRDDLVFVVDLGSKNGTFLGEDRLDPGTPAAARSADVVRFGRVSMQVYAPGALYHTLKMCL